MCIKITTEQFIIKAKAKHGNKFDYSLVDYKDATEKITIICPIHGEFIQNPFDHLKSKNGCNKCSRIVDRKTTEQFIVGCLVRNGGNAKTTDKFAQEAKGIHGDKYDYSKVIYENNNKDIIIICPKHGEFIEKPRVHLCNIERCLKCRYDNKLKSFIDLANKVHKEKYNYSKVEYKTAKDNIIIICPTHGEFLQTPDNHVHGKGCHSCCVAYIGKNELEYFTPYLKNIMGVDIKCQFKVAKDEFSYYAVDFYIPSINLVIEYDEKRHMYKKHQDKIRQDYIINKLNCSFIRIDDQKFMENNEYAKEIIYNYLKKVVDKLQINS